MTATNEGEILAHFIVAVSPFMLNLKTCRQSRTFGKCLLTLALLNGILYTRARTVKKGSLKLDDISTKRGMPKQTLFKDYFNLAK